MDPIFGLSHERRLVMTFALRQSLEILQMTSQELEVWLREEVEKNPLVELEERSSSTSPTEREIPYQPSLLERLQEQVRENFDDPRDRKIAEELIGSLDEKGFIDVRLEPFALLYQKPLSQVESILTTLQTFDPPGIFARDLREAFLIQLKRQGKEKSDAFKLVQDHFEDLLNGRFSILRRRVKDLTNALYTLSRLNQRPAHVYTQESAQQIIPEMRVTKTDTGWILEVLDSHLPRFELQPDYENLQAETPEEKEVLISFRTSAKWIRRSLTRRKRLLLELGKIIVQIQSPYLDQRAPLRELTMRKVAEELQIHESTLSRALSGKYIETPRGILPLRSLLTASPDTESAKDHLQRIVAQEDKKKPFTDEELSLKLKELGFAIARRTIAKYRTQLKISPATRRRHLH
jgi:RNA polymerase sigma-54 factor